MRIQKDINLQKQSVRFTLEATATEVSEVIKAVAPEVHYDPSESIDIVPDEMLMRVIWYYLNKKNAK